MDDESKTTVDSYSGHIVEGAAALSANEVQTSERSILDSDQRSLIRTEEQASTSSIVTTSSDRRRMLPCKSVCNSCKG